MSRKRMEVDELLRLESRIKVIRGLGRLTFILFCAALGFIAVAMAIPQHRELEKLEGKLNAARRNEARVMAEQEHRHIELQALREDPSYLELQARDRLDFCREGERVLRFKRDQ